MDALNEVERVSRGLIVSMSAQPDAIERLLHHTRLQTEIRMPLLGEKIHDLQQQIDTSKDSMEIFHGHVRTCSDWHDNNSCSKLL